jgi:hypothetical protein
VFSLWFGYNNFHPQSLNGELACGELVEPSNQSNYSNLSFIVLSRPAASGSKKANRI